MRNLFTIVAIAISFACVKTAGAQEKKEVDTTILPTEKILSYNDIVEVLTSLEDKTTVSEYRKFAAAIDAVVKKRATEIMEEKRKKFKAKK